MGVSVLELGKSIPVEVAELQDRCVKTVPVQDNKCLGILGHEGMCFAVIYGDITSILAMLAIGLVATAAGYSPRHPRFRFPSAGLAMHAWG